MWLKRVFDVIVALLCLILFMPILTLVSIINFILDQDVLFIQKRVGRNLKLFPVIKFATMTRNAHVEGGTVVTKFDSRVTKHGIILRKTKLNELPQLINVIMGHMSLVGPRPLPKSEVDLYPLKDARKIYSIRPGITGLGSLFFHNEESFLSADCNEANYMFENFIMPRKAILEKWYVDNWSFIFDIKILLATLGLAFIPSYRVLSYIDHGLSGHDVKNVSKDIIELQINLSKDNKDVQ